MGLYGGLREGADEVRDFALYDPSHGQGPQLMEQAAENRSLRAAGRMAGANGGMGVAELDNFKGGLRNWGANHLEGARIDAAKTYKPALDRVMTLGADAAEGGLKARAGAVLGAARTLAAPAQPLWLGGKTAYDVATTPTEDYQKRVGPFLDAVASPFTSRSDFWSKSDSNGAQLAKDLIVRGVGAASDLGNNMALGAPKALGLYSDQQPQAPAPAPERAQAPNIGTVLNANGNTLQYDKDNSFISPALLKHIQEHGPDSLRTPEALRIKQLMQTGGPAASQSTPKLQEGAPFKTAGMSPEMIAQLHAKGIKLDVDPQQQAQATVGAGRMQQLGDVRGMAGQAGEDLYVQRKPGQSPLFTNVSPFSSTAEQQAYARATNGGKNGLRQNPSSGFGVSTIQTPGVEGYMRQLNILRGLRDDGAEGSSGPRVTVIANPDAKGGSTLDKVMSQMDFSGGKKLTADGLDALVGAARADTERARAGNEAVYQQGALGVQSRGQDLNYKLGMQNNAANRLNAMLQRDYEMQRLQMEQGNKNREFGLQQNRLGLDQQKNQFDQQQAATKSIADRLGSMYTMKDTDGKIVPDNDKVADRMRSLNAYLGERAAGLAKIKQGDPRYSQAQAELNLIRTKGIAGMDEQYLHKLLVQKDMQERVQQTHSTINPFASTYVESSDPSSYDITGLRKGLLQARYTLRNGSSIPVNDTRYTEPANSLLPDFKVRTNKFDALKENGTK